jgi:hypothetical protein
MRPRGRQSGTLVLRLGVWAGPLDLLLELARAQRVDLAQLSIATLAAQFAAAVDIAIACRQVRLRGWPSGTSWRLGLSCCAPDPAEGAGACGVYRPNPPALWRMPDALAQMRRLLAAHRSYPS